MREEARAPFGSWCSRSPGLRGQTGSIDLFPVVRDPECHGLADPFHGRGPRADPGQADPRPAGRNRDGDVLAALPAAAPRAVPAVARTGEEQATPQMTALTSLI